VGLSSVIAMAEHTRLLVLEKTPLEVPTATARSVMTAAGAVVSVCVCTIKSLPLA